jgi:hypothetical protein
MHGCRWRSQATRRLSLGVQRADKPSSIAGRCLWRPASTTVAPPTNSIPEPPALTLSNCRISSHLIQCPRWPLRQRHAGQCGDRPVHLERRGAHRVLGCRRHRRGTGGGAGDIPAVQHGRAVRFRHSVARGRRLDKRLLTRKLNDFLGDYLRGRSARSAKPSVRSAYSRS